MFFLNIPGRGGYHNMMASTANQLLRMIVVVVTFIPYCIGFAILYPAYLVIRTLYRAMTPRRVQQRIAIKADIAKRRARKIGKAVIFAVIVLFAVITTVSVVKGTSQTIHGEIQVAHQTQTQHR
jgi:hypothetical protein